MLSPNSTAEWFDLFMHGFQMVLHSPIRAQALSTAAGIADSASPRPEILRTYLTQQDQGDPPSNFG